MILYPTETVYGLGVNALDPSELEKLFVLKGRDSQQVASWLVRSGEDIKKYAVVDALAEKIIQQFLPGPLTLILPTLPTVDREVVAMDGTIGFRISSDTNAQSLIERFMAEHEAPLTCTSANVHKAPTMPTTPEILTQFGEAASIITEVIDDGERQGVASTVVRVINGEVEVLREGAISTNQIESLVN